MHTKLLYPYVHKVHHEYTATIGIASEYSHPIDFALGSAIPVVIPCILLGKNMHFFTFIIWSMYRLAETTDGHSGYEFSWSPYRLIPFSASATYHEFHHSYNMGNYSSFFVTWDTFFGTNKMFYRIYEKKKKLEE
jgi:sterol desaturase/sphingolipid hydroxylase (fatty acid hydroxylase superfamily)